jgi:uncharacterized membrane protein
VFTFSSFRGWFTAQRRQAIYVTVAATVPALVLTGVITDSQTEYVLTLTAAVLQVIAGVLALTHLTPTEAGERYVTVWRAGIYALAATTAPAAVGLGWITETQGATVLTALSVGLTVLGALIGVITLTPDRTAK